MLVKTSVSSLMKQLQTISKLVPPTSGSVSLEVKKNNLRLYSVNDLAVYESIVPCDAVEGENIAFGVTLDSLKAALAKRKEVELSYVNTMLVITEGTYRAELTTTDAVELSAVNARREDSDEEVKTWTVSAEQSNWLKDAVSAVNLKVPEGLAAFMPVTIKITEKGGFVACYDNAHMAFIRSSDISGDLDVTMPCDLLSSVFSVFQNASFKMHVSESRLQLVSKLVKIGLSLPVRDSYIDVSILLKMANDTLKAEGNALTLSRSTLVDFLDSCKAVAAKERSELCVKAKGKKMQMQVKTVSGNVNQVLPLDAPANVQFNIDFTYFEEAVRKNNDAQITIKVITDASVLIGAKNGWVIVSVNA